MTSGLVHIHTMHRYLPVVVGVCLATQPVWAQDANDPHPDVRAVVSTAHARFTVLTSRMIRMEWSADGRFEDRPSLVFINRRLSVPEFSQRRDHEWLTIETGSLRLRYRDTGSRFDSTNLEVRLVAAGRRVVWRPGMPDTANLGGTIRTLDGVKGPVPVGSGLLSRDGWVLVDDSERPLFDDSDWPWVGARVPGDRLDWYFLGYGHDYVGTLRDFTRVAGRIPMPPRFAFGNWWSRYWAYTDQEFMQLVREFQTFDVPLDVLVVDMDWHETFELRWSRNERDQAGQPLGWTGYTWNRAYFPDPGAFLAWTDRQGLRTPLNLHPASGIQPHEAPYPAMARAMGIDPATKQYVPFRIEDKKFAQAYFGNVIHPLERQGVDFWWLDWQQWGETSIPGLTPTWWLNYVFFTDMEREGRHRPLIFHRFGGLGNHRYQVGFSGDAHSTWDMLAFEPYFTSTASNVLYGYWSHDIGGHLNGEVTPELYTRWVQFGVLSPIFRTHTTKNPKAERRIWAYPPEYFTAMRDAIRLRYALLPYIYTAAREAYETGVSLLRPMYYAYPESAAAYAVPDEYMFGDDLIASPVVTPVADSSLLARASVWLPPGDWLEWSSGTMLHGGRTIDRAFALDEIPLYARAGAIIPMQRVGQHAGSGSADPLVLTLIPGASGETRVYEDAGDSLGYRAGEYAWTTVRQTRAAGDSLVLEVLPTEGSFRGMASGRNYEIRLARSLPPARVTLDGVEVLRQPDGTAPGWRYDGDALATVVAIPRTDVHRGFRLTVTGTGADADVTDGVKGQLRRMERAMQLLDGVWPDDWAPDAYVALVETGRRMTLEPAHARDELTRFRADLSSVLDRVRAMRGDSAVVRRALRHLEAHP
jgi:Glycosyl hydrolases family 31 TIM-barrel domain/Glycosyl hydrolase family 31 C-terminal domain/Domain of unknown function (DUF5110)